ncbi:hypothetical protein PhCBS80983_g02519 [Powellomyces hirtus]|uniref:N-lysine methyltransferase SETD6 n=1 Tax=Powellomyces hirtus TaxID=109895 RepID=A0A507E7H6_9FUNG|nr:hypothetical protein PhCBS80983_g02519 [Powellomyces hirtus]
MMATCTSDTAAERLQELKEWFSAHDIEYDSDAIELRVVGGDDRPSYAVFAKEDLDVEQTICRIPKESVLSVRNCGIADILEQAELGGVLGLAFCVMYEKSLGAKSPWAAYLRSLPESEHLPILWSEEDFSALTGTDVEEQTVRDRALLEDDYATHVGPLVEEHGFPPEHFTYEKFLQAASLVSSRAFEIDAHHGESMVPLADLFNHQTPTSLAEGEHVHFETDADVCPYCGANGACYCEDLEDEDDIEDVDEFDDEEGEEVVELVTDDEDDEPPELYDPEDWMGHSDEHKDPASYAKTHEVDFLEMNLIRPCAAGEEVYNTYGEHGNDYLLSHYGFAEPKNPFDSVSLSMDAILDGLRSRLNPDRIEERCAFWTQVGRSVVESILDPEHEESDDDDEEEVEDQEDDGEEDEHSEDGSEDTEEPERDNFYFDFAGKASENLLAFLYVLFVDAAVFRAFTESTERFERYVHTLRNGGWIVKSTASGSSGPKGARSAKGRGKPAQSTSGNSPLDRAISMTLLALATGRDAMYPTTLEEDKSKLKKLAVSSATNCRRSALLLRIGEKEILARAKKNYMAAAPASRR